MEIIKPRFIKPKYAKAENYALYEFNSLNDLIDYTMQITDNLSGRKTYELQADLEWAGVPDMDTFKRWLTYGNPVQIDKLLKAVKMNERIFEQGNKLGYKIKKSCVGFRPNIPKAIMNLPDAMYRLKYEKTPNKIINFLIDSNCSWYVEQEDYEEHFKKVFSYMYQLEKRGFRVKITAFTTFGRPQDHHKNMQIVNYCVKREYEQFNLSKMSFACTLLAFFRGLLLYLLHHNCDLPDVRYRGSGSPLYTFEKYKCYEDYFNEIININRKPTEKVVYVNYETDIEKLKELIER